MNARKTARRQRQPLAALRVGVETQPSFPAGLVASVLHDASFPHPGRRLENEGLGAHSVVSLVFLIPKIHRVFAHE